MSRVLVVVVLVVAFASTWEISALTVGKLNQLNRDYYHQGFGFSWDNAEFVCPSQRCSIARAAYDLHAPRFNGNNPPDFYKFAATLIDYVDFAETRTGFSALAEVISKDDGHMRLYGPFFSTNNEVRAGTYVHEAAHIKSGVPNHSTCDNGQPCDDIFYGDYQGGAYNYEFMYYGWLSRGSNYTELNRSVAEFNMRRLVNSRFRRVSNQAVASWFPNPQPDAQPRRQYDSVFDSNYGQSLANAIINSALTGINTTQMNVNRRTYSSGGGSITINQYFGRR